ncbi:hypothetical protein, partial [Kingella denitrificans]|uniref:hypothetical protein n=1 Tax=Kingella denitrificans TaxID=502 RepID=UPI0028D4787F
IVRQGEPTPYHCDFNSLYEVQAAFWALCSQRRGFFGMHPISGRAAMPKSGYGGDTPFLAFKFAVPVQVCARSRERERVAGCFVRFRAAFGRRMRSAEKLVELRKQPAF